MMRSGWRVGNLSDVPTPVLQGCRRTTRYDHHIIIGWSIGGSRVSRSPWGRRWEEDKALRVSLPQKPRGSHCQSRSARTALNRRYIRDMMPRRFENI